MKATRDPFDRDAYISYGNISPGDRCITTDDGKILIPRNAITGFIFILKRLDLMDDNGALFMVNQMHDGDRTARLMLTARSAIKVYVCHLR